MIHHFWHIHIPGSHGIIHEILNLSTSFTDSKDLELDPPMFEIHEVQRFLMEHGWTLLGLLGGSILAGKVCKKVMGLQWSMDSLLGGSWAEETAETFSGQGTECDKEKSSSELPFSFCRPGKHGKLIHVLEAYQIAELYCGPLSIHVTATRY